VSGRWRRARTPLVIVVLLLLVPAVAVLIAGSNSHADPLDPASATPQGARAVAEVLRGQGVTVTRAERVQQARRALGGATADGAADAATLVVTDPDVVDPERLAALARSAMVVVLIEPDDATLGAVAPNVTVVRSGLAASEAPVRAGCGDPDAEAAGTATGGGAQLDAGSGSGSSRDSGVEEAETCFGGAYAVVSTPSHSVRVFGQGEVLMNEHLTEGGNAALALRSLGAAPRVVWLVGSPLDAATGQAQPSLEELLPRWVIAVGVQLLIAAVVVVVWRARRLGALVTEPLPVVVRSVETAEGRAALYRASGDRAAAATALRAAAVWRLTARLGLPPATPAEQVVLGAAATTGRRPEEVAFLLLGPPPSDDEGLVRLADALDDLAPHPAPSVGPAGAAPHEPAHSP
jgi:Domain of unknown function (DUF4350)